MSEIATKPRASEDEQTSQKTNSNFGVRRPAVVAVVVCCLVAVLASVGWLTRDRWLELAQSSDDGQLRITRDTVWGAGEPITLTGRVFVEAGARLTIEAGAQILGEAGSALIITQDATIDAQGTADQPIVFTSSRPEGTRKRGDWGGLALLGRAPVNRIKGVLEGLDDDPRGLFGGLDTAANCGTLRYVRIEFAGFEALPGNELNGLTLAGCGSSTVIDHVQVHRSLDDGVEIFGGTVNLKHLAITGAGDDGLDWDLGWTGKAQFLFIQQFADSGDKGVEGDNNYHRHNALPRSAPTIFNVTIVSPANAKKRNSAVVLRRGSAGRFGNVLIAGQEHESVDIRDLTTASLIGTGELAFTHFLFSTTTGDARSALHEEREDDGGFNESSYFADPAKGMVWTTRSPGPDERLTVAFVAPDVAQDDVAPAPFPPGKFWSRDATFVGATAPGPYGGWLNGWTGFPRS